MLIVQLCRVEIYHVVDFDHSIVYLRGVYKYGCVKYIFYETKDLCVHLSHAQFSKYKVSPVSSNIFLKLKLLPGTVMTIIMKEANKHR